MRFWHFEKLSSSLSKPHFVKWKKLNIKNEGQRIRTQPSSNDQASDSANFSEKKAGVDLPFYKMNL